MCPAVWGPQPTTCQAWGLLPSSSLSPGALAGEASSLSPMQTGRAVDSPKEPTVAWRLPSSGSALRAETFSPLFLPKASRGETAVGNGTVPPAVSPLLPAVLSKWVCHPDQEALGGGLLMGWPRMQVQPLPTPSSSEQERQPRVEGRPRLPPYVSFCK